MRRHAAPSLRPATRRSPLRASRSRAPLPSPARPRRHRVVDLVQVWQQAQTVLTDESIGLNAGLVPVEAQIGIEPGHADVDEGLAKLPIGVRLAEARLVPHPVGQFDDVDVVMMACIAARHCTSLATDRSAISARRLRARVVGPAEAALKDHGRPGAERGEQPLSRRQGNPFPALGTSCQRRRRANGNSSNGTRRSGLMNVASRHTSQRPKISGPKGCAREETWQRPRIE